MARIVVIENARDPKYSTSEMSDAKLRQGTFLKKKRNDVDNLPERIESQYSILKQENEIFPEAAKLMVESSKLSDPIQIAIELAYVPEIEPVVPEIEPVVVDKKPKTTGLRKLFSIFK